MSKTSRRSLELLRLTLRAQPRSAREDNSVVCATKLMQPLLDAGLVQRIGTRKTGRYILA